MTLDQFLIKAEVCTYHRHLFFAGCTYQSGVLFVPDRQLGETIARQFGPDLRRVVSDLVIRVSGPMTIDTEPLPKSLKRGARAWHAKQGRLDGA
jgi:hypothetical protein